MFVCFAAECVCWGVGVWTVLRCAWPISYPVVRQAHQPSLSKGTCRDHLLAICTVFTLRVAQKGQPFWTSRRDVAVPGPSQVTREEGFSVTRLVHNTRCFRLSKALFPQLFCRLQCTAFRLLLNKKLGLSGVSCGETMRFSGFYAARGPFRTLWFGKLTNQACRRVLVEIIC
jgi:hypothetical protein